MRYVDLVEFAPRVRAACDLVDRTADIKVAEAGVSIGLLRNVLLVLTRA